MPVRLSNLARTTTSVAVKIHDETLTVAYRPAHLTPETQDRLQAMIDESHAGEALVAFVLNAVASWDLTDDDDAMLPITEETLRGLPVELLSAVVVAINEDMRPNLTSAEVSGAGSSRVGSLASARNGTR